MHWQNAIKLSPIKSAVRFVDINMGRGKGFKRVTIRYPDGTGLVMITHNNEVNWLCSRKALPQELEGFKDWEPRM